MSPGIPMSFMTVFGVASALVERMNIKYSYAILCIHFFQNVDNICIKHDKNKNKKNKNSLSAPPS